MHFYEQYTEFLLRNNINSKDKLTQSIYYPLLVKKFFHNIFEPEMYEGYLSSIDQEINMNEMYFTFGCFLMPKFSLNAIDFQPKEAI